MRPPLTAHTEPETAFHPHMSSPSTRTEERRQKARKLLRDFKLDALLITGEANVTYLTGFSGDSTHLLIFPESDLLVSDFRYVTQLAEECPGIEARIRDSSLSLQGAVSADLKDKKARRIGFEGHLLTIETFQILQASLSDAELVPVNWRIEELRAVKDADEIAEIRRAVTFAERGFEYLKAIVTPHITEIQLAHELEHAMRRLGADGVSFPPIVAVGDRAALPHYRPGDIPVSADPLLLVDWGAQTRRHYKSDLTRVLVHGKKNKFEKVYGTVLEAQQRAIAAIRPGVNCSAVDACARDYIREQGYGKRFDHGLGHGIGLHIHELPRFSKASQNVLVAGMVVTVEPGIYLPGWGGVRIEDDVLVTRDGGEVLSTRIPKDLASTLIDL